MKILRHMAMGVGTHVRYFSLGHKTNQPIFVKLGMNSTPLYSLQICIYYTNSANMVVLRRTSNIVPKVAGQWIAPLFVFGTSRI
jgi:hypothetical protein